MHQILRVRGVLELRPRPHFRSRVQYRLLDAIGSPYRNQEWMFAACRTWANVLHGDLRRIYVYYTVLAGVCSILWPKVLITVQGNMLLYFVALEVVRALPEAEAVTLRKALKHVA